MERSTIWKSRGGQIRQSTFFSADARRVVGKSAMKNLYDWRSDGVASKRRTCDRFVSTGSRDRSEFENSCCQPERESPLRSRCAQLYNTRSPNQDAYLYPLVSRSAPPQSSCRIETSKLSTYVLLVSNLLLIGSFILPSWLEVLPLGLVLLMMPIGFAKNRFLLLSFLLRAIIVATNLMEVSTETRLRSLVDICCLMCALVLAWSAMREIVDEILRNERKSSHPFIETSDLQTALITQLTFLNLENARYWVGRRMSAQIDLGLRALSLGKLSLGPPVESQAVERCPCLLKSSRCSKSSFNASGMVEGDRSSPAPRWCSNMNVPTHHRVEHTDRDPRSTTITRTDQMLVGERPQCALWTVAALLAALLFKLCWSDLTHFGEKAYISFCHVPV